MGDILKQMQARVEKARMHSLTKTKKEPLPSTTIQPSFECMICQDTEYIVTKMPGTILIGDKEVEVMNDVARDCECKAKKRLKRLMQSSQITDEFRNMTFKLFDYENKSDVIQEMYKTAYDYVRAFNQIRATRKNSCCLLGQPGTGKTHLLTAVSNNLLSKGVAVQYFPWVEGISDLQSDLDASNDKLNQMQRVELLFIDDMYKGRSTPTPWQLEKIFGVINYRYLNNLPVLISSEKTIAQMCEFDEATASRINEMCKDYKVTIKKDISLNYRLQEDEA